MNLKTVAIAGLILAGILGVAFCLAWAVCFRPDYESVIRSTREQVQALESRIEEANGRIGDLQRQYGAVNGWMREEGSRRVEQKVQVVRDADAVGLCRLMDAYVLSGDSISRDTGGN